MPLFGYLSVTIQCHKVDKMTQTGRSNIFIKTTHILQKMTHCENFNCLNEIIETMGCRQINKVVMILSPCDIFLSLFNSLLSYTAYKDQ